MAFVKSLFPESGIERTYVTSTFIGTIGAGILLPISILYFTRIVGLPAAEVGLAFTVSGLLAIPASIPAGALADRVGPRRVMTAALAALGVVGVAYLFVQNFWTLLAVQTLMGFSLAAYFPSAGALLRRVGGERTVTIRSQTRAVTNLGVALGSLIAGIGIEIGTPTAYRILAVTFSAAQVTALLLLFRLPNYQPLPRPSQDAPHTGETGTVTTPAPKRIALRDKAFVAYALVGGAMAVQNMIMEIMVPVWIVGHTHAPAWSVTVAFVLNTALVVLLQVRLGDKVQTITDGGTALRRAGIALLLGCVALSLMTDLPAWAALLLLIVGMVLLTLGEIWYVSGTFAFEYGLPPAYAQGQYQGFSSAASAAAKAVAPALLLGFALSHGRIGWLGLGALLLLLGLAGPAIAGWGVRTRPATTTTEPVTAETSTPTPSPADDPV
ncbi:MFS transporter [Streptomyces sp. NPDC096152]|uniref:MFS transporter n=1 Tax=Streptomyces sp. NPDC096152 TaxID=3366078 RepID=UPI0038223099